METLETMDDDLEYYREMMEDDKYYNYNDNDVNSEITESSVTSTKTLYLPTTDTSSIQTTAHPSTSLKNKEKGVILLLIIKPRFRNNNSIFFYF